VFLLDDLLFGGPIKTVKWVLGQLQTIAEKEMTNEEPVMQAILENEMALEDGRVTKAEYEETQAGLMVRLREIRELKKRIAEEKAAAAGMGPAPGAAPGERPKGPLIGGKEVSGKAKLEIDLDFGGYGQREDR
jgi:hypothetical protein